LSTHALSAGLAQRLRAFYALTKPRVVSLILLTAVIGMFLATPGMVPPGLLAAATLGIALVAGAAAAINCLVERKIDALMRRTRWRPLVRGALSTSETLVFAGLIGGTRLGRGFRLRFSIRSYQRKSQGSDGESRSSHLFLS